MHGTTEGMTYSDIVAAAKALVPEIQGRAGEIAGLRRLPPDLVQKLKQAGAFRMLMPKAWGGPELTPRQQNEVIEIYATADASVAWCIMIGSDSGFFVGFHDDETARALYPDLDSCIAGAASPLGSATRVEGGYRVNGRWSFGSNVNNADVIIAICPVMEGDKPSLINGFPETIMVAAPADEWEIHDTWYTTGLAGSGSTDYSANDLFVPERQAIKGHIMAKPYRPEPLYAWWGTFLANMHGVALGLARHSIDTLRALAEQKRAPNFTRAKESLMMKDVPRVMASIARAEMDLAATRAYTYETMDRLWDELNTRGVPSREVRAAVALSRTHAFRTVKEITRLMVETAGSTAIYSNCPLESFVRDATVMGMHWSAQERVLEPFGAYILGSDTPGAMI